MNERELGKALLQLGAVQPDVRADPRELSRRIIEKDRRRVRWLTWLTAFVWLLASGPLFFMLFHVIDSAVRRAQSEEEFRARTDAGAKAAAELMNRVDIRLHNVEGRAENASNIAIMVACCLAALAVAHFLTVVLLFASRRATLRQVNANLLEISEKLNQLRSEHATRT